MTVIEVPRFCNGNVVAFKEKSSLKWQLGIIELLEVMPHNKQIVVHEWTETVKKPGTSDFIVGSVKQWNDILKQLTKRAYHLNQVNLKFLGQIRGATINGVPLVCSTRNRIDNGLQCCILCPDVLIVKPPLI